jgi:hypothetical protein
MKTFYSKSAVLLTMIVATLITIFAQPSSGGSATWLANPPSSDWNNAANWTAGGPPNDPADIATFATSSQTGISLSANVGVNGMTFNSGADAFTISASPGFQLTITGAGIVNNSSVSQNFATAVNGAGDHGEILFTNSASAGSMTVFTNNGATASFFTGLGGVTVFSGTSTAGNATFINNGGSVDASNGGFTQFLGGSTAGNGTFTNNGSTSVAPGGATGFNDTSTAGHATITNNGNSLSNPFSAETFFADTSSADNATIINNGGSGSDVLGGSTGFGVFATAGNATLIANGGSGGGFGGKIYLAADGGTAQVKVFGNGNVDLSINNPPEVTTIGSLEGDGDVFLSANSLIIGTNNLSTSFSGVIQDGGDNGGTGGSLGKIGTGTLSLASANIYTGSTRLNGGTLEALHDGAVGAGDVIVLTPGVTLTLQNGATNDYIADTATLNIVSSATINLNFTGTDTIGTLIVDGVAQPPALHGSGGSSAPRSAHQTSGFSGTGKILAELPVAVSRKLHGATAYDIYLPPTGSPGIECRSGGGSNIYQVVVSFLNNATFNSASVTSGQGMVSTTSGNGTKTIMINLSGVTNAQTINVTLFNLNDGLGVRDLVIPMSVLVGDTTGNGTVNSTDVSQTKGQSGHVLTTANFREDVAVSGQIDSSDISTVKLHSGSGLPAATLSRQSIAAGSSPEAPEPFLVRIPTRMHRTVIYRAARAAEIAR